MLKTEELLINLGPQHPSTHGVYRCVMKLNGETVTSAENHIGYLHRGVEKIAETRTYGQFIPYTDRLDYVAAMLNEFAYVLSVEKLMNLEVPPRAQYLRIIMAELQRIASHLVYLGSMALDMGAFTGWMYCFRDREKIMDLFQWASGTRLTHNYFRIGGVNEDLPEEFGPALEDFIDNFPQGLEEYYNFIYGNEILLARTKGIGIITKEMALEYGITGPNLRASGVDLDLRRDAPYSVYDQLDFHVPTRDTGDSFDRMVLRIEEMAESLRMIRQAWERLPEGPITAKVPKIIKPPVGEAFVPIEGAKGILGFYVISDGTAKPYRIHIHSPSFVNLGVFPEIAKGTYIQDTIVSLASIDIVLGEVDR